MVCKSVDPLYNQEWQKILHFTFGNPWSTVYCGEPADCRARPRPLIAPYSNMVPWICKNRTIWGPPVQPRVTENITALYFWHPLEHCALWRTSRLQSQTKTINCTIFKYGSLDLQKPDYLGTPCTTKSDRKYNCTLLLAPPGALCTVENQQAAEPDQDH